jgi:hypothetical protein
MIPGTSLLPITAILGSYRLKVATERQNRFVSLGELVKLRPRTTDLRETMPDNFEGKARDSRPTAKLMIEFEDGQVTGGSRSSATVRHRRRGRLFTWQSSLVSRTAALRQERSVPKVNLRPTRRTSPAIAHVCAISEQVTTIRDLESHSLPWMLSLLFKSYLVTT